MALETILQSELLVNFVYPFLFIFIILYAILTKTRIFGEGQNQINAIISFVMGLIFVSVAFPKFFVNNMILFLTLAVTIVFVALVIFAFATGTDLKEKFVTKGLKWAFGIFLLIVIIMAVIWASGTQSTAIDFLFHQSWSSALWTNAAFILIIAVALAVILKTKK